MDFTSAWFLLVMIVVGGAIAVLADNLGRKLGKSRLRVGKLRPRHTAMLFTAITGAIVTLTTVMLVAILSAEVREWIIKGQAAVRQARIGEKALISMDAELNRKFAELNEADMKLRKQNEQINSLNNQLKLAQGSVKRFEGQATSAESRASIASAKLSEREARLAELSKNLSAGAKRLAAVQKDAAKLSSTYQKLNSNYKQLNANYQKLSTDISKAYEQDRILREQNMNLEASNATLQKDIEGLNTRLNKGIVDLNELTGKISTQEKILEDTQRMVFNYRAGAIGARTRPIIFNINEEIARREVSLALTYAEAEQRVRSTINLAAEEIYRRTNLNIALREAALGTHTSDEIVGILARKLLDSKGQASIVVQTATNIFGDEEFVPVEVAVLSNPVVFKRGDVLGEVKIPGDQSVDQIITMITSMLGKQVRDKAVQARMHGAEDPDSQIGRAGPADTIKVVNTIKEVNRPVRVFAVAKTDTRASGPLEIEFRVR